MQILLETFQNPNRMMNDLTNSAEHVPLDKLIVAQISREALDFFGNRSFFDDWVTHYSLSLQTLLHNVETLLA